MFVFLDTCTVGGPGMYTVVHCGAAGHNIRTSPGMKGIPVGRLAKGSSVEIEEEVSYTVQITCTVHVLLYNFVMKEYMYMYSHDM